VYNWKKIILKESSTMQEAIVVLNSEALRIVLVVDEDEKLVGTVTDGDIRRALLRHMMMNTELSEFMFTTPTIASMTEERDQLLQKMHALDLLQIPVVDVDGRVTGLETLQHLLEKRRYDNPVFLMAGGFGKRLRPLTEHTPKPMLNVGSRPILETILEQFIEAGFHDFYISTHYKAEVVHNYFGDGNDRNVSIHYIHEDKPLGTAGALGLLPKDLPDLPMLMMNGDLLTKMDFTELLNFHAENGGEATMCVREYDFQVPYGVVQSDEHRITSIIEKPTHQFFVNAGIYVLNPTIVKAVDRKACVDMPHLLTDKINNNVQVNMYPLHEYWLDIGQIEQYEQAQIDSKAIL